MPFLFNFVIVHIEHIARFNSIIMEKSPLILLLLEYGIFLQLHLLKLFILNLFQHLLFLFTLVDLLSCTFKLHNFNSFQPLFVRHIQFGSLIIWNFVPWTHTGHSNIFLSANYSFSDRAKRCFLTRLWSLRNWLLGHSRFLRSQRLSVMIWLWCLPICLHKFLLFSRQLLVLSNSLNERFNFSFK